MKLTCTREETLYLLFEGFESVFMGTLPPATDITVLGNQEYLITVEGIMHRDKVAVATEE